MEDFKKERWWRRSYSNNKKWFAELADYIIPGHGMVFWNFKK